MNPLHKESFPPTSFQAKLEINKWATPPFVQTGSSVHRTGRQEASLGTPAPNTIVVVSSLALQARDRHWENKQCLSVTRCTDRGSRMHVGGTGTADASPQICCPRRPPWDCAVTRLLWQQGAAEQTNPEWRVQASFMLKQLIDKKM